ncbi:MAG: homoserine O-acetyltransferase MetX [Gammaproteobacteria bacterium]
MSANLRPSLRLPNATRFVRIDKPFPLFRGGVLPEVEIAYECWGRLAPRRDNAVLLFTGLSPSAHAASSANDPEPGWWEYMIGPGKPIDTRKYFVVCVNSLGSCFGSTGPASVNPESGGIYRLEFPELSVEDIARAGREVYRALQISRLHTVIGPSLGGMSAVALAVLFPDEVARLVSISAAARATPFAIAIRSLQREIIRKDPKWRQGDYDFDDPPVEGIRLARKLGLITYRSPEEYLDRFARKRKFAAHAEIPPFSPEFEVEHYLEYNADAFIHRFDTNCYLYLSRAIDWFDLALHGGSVAKALARIRTVKNLIIGVETDFLFPIWQQREIAEGLERDDRTTRFEALGSIQGHDSFLIDEERFAPLLQEFFA